LLGAIIRLAAVGAVVGLLAGLIARGSRLRIAGDAAFGALGAVGSGFLLPSLGVEAVTGHVGTFVAGVAGAIVTVPVARLLGHLAFR
jgi:uncharacterized membrane protein YeaQ/YmgE (transglycosylase-associated protein family)